MSERVDVQQLRDLILEAVVTPDATPYGAAIRNKGRDALDALLARLDALEEVAEAAEALVDAASAQEALPHADALRVALARLREGKA